MRKRVKLTPDKKLDHSPPDYLHSINYYHPLLLQLNKNLILFIKGEVSQLGEQSTLKCEKNYAGFPSVSLPVSQFSTRLPKSDVSNLKTTHTETKSPTTDRIPQPPTQSSEKNDVGLKRMFTRLWGKKGKNKEEPS